MLHTLSVLAVATTAAAAPLPASASAIKQVPVATLEAVVDRGPIMELFVKCSGGGGTAILSYSKLERLYCGPKAKCDRKLEVIADRVCNR